MYHLENSNYYDLLIMFKSNPLLITVFKFKTRFSSQKTGNHDRAIIKIQQMKLTTITRS